MSWRFVLFIYSPQLRRALRLLPQAQYSQQLSSFVTKLSLKMIC
jgi:hypothetical protein